LTIGAILEITFEGNGWDPATQALVRGALGPLADAGVRSVALVRGAVPREEVWEAWIETHDGRCDGVVTWGDCHTLSDLLPLFLEDLRWLAIPQSLRTCLPPRYQNRDWGPC